MPEFTLALLLGLAKNIPSGNRTVKEGQWVAGKERATYDNIELAGKTHAVVGMGEIGSRVAAVSKALGMKVFYFRRTRNAHLERLLGVEYAPFDKLIRESDTISIYTPLTDETRNLFNTPQFEATKRTALLINQSRGQVVNEEALLRALNEGKIGGYATDVYEKEPPAPNSALMKRKNVIVAPHVGGRGVAAPGHELVRTNQDQAQLVALKLAPAGVANRFERHAERPRGLFEALNDAVIGVHICVLICVQGKQTEAGPERFENIPASGERLRRKVVAGPGLEHVRAVGAAFAVQRAGHDR